MRNIELQMFNRERWEDIKLGHRGGKMSCSPDNIHLQYQKDLSHNVRKRTIWHVRQRICKNAGASGQSNRSLSEKHTYIILTPYTPLVYSKTGVCRGIHYFSYIWNMKNIRIFIWKLSVLMVNFSIYLNRRVFVMLRCPHGIKKLCILGYRKPASKDPVSILRKSISGRHRPFRVADGPMTARCRFT